MNKDIIVIYSSKYGTTKTYAEWISNSLNSPVYNLKDIKNIDITKYKTIIYGSGLYAGGIMGKNFINNLDNENIILFTVGLSNPDNTDYSEIINKNIDNKIHNKLKIFHLRGGIDYNVLSIIHKIMMAMLKKFKLDTKSPSEITDEDRLMIETYGNSIYFLDKASIEPILDYIKINKKLPM